MKKRYAKQIKRAVVLALIGVITIPQAVIAATFNQNFILSDSDLESSSTMSVSRIQRFLELKGSGLASIKTNDPSGIQKTAAQIIYDAGQFWTINPQYLMVRLQVEQSLITRANPTQKQLDWASGYAVCDSCSTDDPAIQKFKGFFNQVNWAARRIRESYLTDLDTRGTTISGWGVGITKTITDGFGTFLVTPANRATAAMYTYTPHVYNANFNVWTFFNDWFTKNYPDGSLLQVQGERGVYLIQNGKRRGFLSRTALISRFDLSRIIIVSPSSLDLYEEGLPIKFANYSLLRSNSSGRIWLIDGDDKRLIETPEIFRSIGFNPEEVVEVPESDLKPYSLGPNINMQSIHPTGVLLQSLTTGGITYVENGIRYSIWSREILKNRFTNRVPVVVEQTTIDQYPQGDPIKFKDGELITSPGSRGVYFISNGQRRGIASQGVFDSLGLKWNNIIWTSDEALAIHPLGSPIDIGQ
ncbi:hypothetical protein IID19_01740 [Patescibacteria group bacterium]|nr:hypothetical protein [Patescibacteria group bacterium]